jgi:hypothetical protein
MEKLFLNKDTCIYKMNFIPKTSKEIILDLVDTIVKNNPIGQKTDGYGYYRNFQEINEIINNILLECKNLFDKNNEYKILEDLWINIVRINPLQRNRKYTKFDDLFYHNHHELNGTHGLFVPQYTFVFYLQMPNNLKDDEGYLFIKDSENNIHGILPNENEALIFNGNIPHGPHYAPNSTKNRVVIAGNVGFEKKYNHKNIKTFL